MDALADNQDNKKPPACSFVIIKLMNVTCAVFNPKQSLM